MGKINNVSIEIAKKWSTTPEVIAYIRSCHKNLHLDHAEMTTRQITKIEGWKREFAHLPKAVERREELAKLYPQDAAKHLAAAKNIQQLIDQNTKGGGKRSDILNFLNKLSESQFKDIVR